MQKRLLAFAPRFFYSEITYTRDTSTYGIFRCIQVQLPQKLNNIDVFGSIIMHQAKGSKSNRRIQSM